MAPELSEKLRSNQDDLSLIIDPVLAWLGPERVRYPAKSLASRFLHAGLIRSPTFHGKLKNQLQLKVSTSGTTVFMDGDQTILSIGFAGATATRLLPEVVGELWLEEIDRSAEYAGAALDAWIERQFAFSFYRQPYGSKIFARILEAALFDGDPLLEARPDALGEAVRGELAKAEALISEITSGRHVVLEGRRRAQP